MRHGERPATVAASVAAAGFPVYGIVGNPFSLSLCSHGLGISSSGNVMSISLTFTSPLYSSQPRYAPESQNVQLFSLDARLQYDEKAPMTFEIPDPRSRRLSEEEYRQAGSPLTWEGEFSIANVNFAGTILHWPHPVPLSSFLLISEKTVLLGDTYGPSYEELVHMLAGLQIINDRQDILRQYEAERKLP